MDPADLQYFIPDLTPSDDILFGGLGGDWVHGGVGDERRAPNPIRGQHAQCTPCVR